VSQLFSVSVFGVRSWLYLDDSGQVKTFAMDTWNGLESMQQGVGKQAFQCLVTLEAQR